MGLTGIERGGGEGMAAAGVARDVLLISAIVHTLEM